jgi:hypothetical protein
MAILFCRQNKVERLAQPDEIPVEGGPESAVSSVRDTTILRS